MKRNHWALWLSGLAILLSACEKDLPEGESMTAVPVIFSISNEDFGANEQVLRDAKAIKPKTVTIPLNDTYYLRATLKPDTVMGLRSDELRASLKDGQRVRFEAYTYSGGVYQSAATYTYSSGTGALTAIGGNPLKVEPNGTNYRFVAFSYFADNYKGTNPASSYIYPYYDLVCGYRDQAITNSIAGRKVGLINMEHKFSRVRVKIDASEVANSITIPYGGVVIHGGDRASLSVFDRTISRVNGADISLGLSSNGTGSVMTTDYGSYYPTVSSVDIPDLTLSLKSGGNYVVPSCTLDFDEPLLPNTSYTLVVDLREVPYARSNIYWDGSKLTFDRTNKGNEDFHGVLFKWGSLVGISPEEGHLVERVQYVPLYIPANISSRTWDDTKTIGTSAFGSWAGIPGGTMSDDFSNHRGDICRYIDDDWRIPLYTWGGLVEQGITFSSVSNPNDATGRGSAGSAGFTDSKYGMFFPASLYRNSDGVLSNPYLYAGYYMGGGSPNNTFYFESSGNAYSGIGIGTNDLSHVGFSVRCIKADF